MWEVGGKQEGTRLNLSLVRALSDPHKALGRKGTMQKPDHSQRGKSGVGRRPQSPRGQTAPLGTQGKGGEGCGVGSVSPSTNMQECPSIEHGSRTGPRPQCAPQQEQQPQLRACQGQDQG